jgi:hypothetical protein
VTIFLSPQYNGNGEKNKPEEGQVHSALKPNMLIFGFNAK